VNARTPRCYKACVNVLGLITARGGSKGIPGKNLAPCGGKPLLAWTAAASLHSTCVTRTVISTDDAQIADYAKSVGVDAPFLRPAELATDTATSIDVAIHAASWLREHEHWSTDILVLLQPTSPLRVSRHIDEAFALLADSADSVCSVMEVPHRFNPWTVLELDDGHLHDYQPGELPFDRHRRQGQPKLYARNGPVVIVTRIATIMARSFYGDRSVPYFMSATDSVDIDDRDDLVLADWLLRERARSHGAD
jgi:CMP-N,N'-diacetyllegionaminic acid synthase